MKFAKSIIKQFQSIQNIQDFIQSHLTIHTKEKDTYGEVFTPYEPITELFDQLPHTVWKNPDLKWLDPSAGIGHFALVAYFRLMNGLKQKIPDPTTRHNHIIRNMLYMVEINPKNVEKCKEIFGKDANVQLADFLEQSVEPPSPDPQSHQHPHQQPHTHPHPHTQYDIIMGNPPFQEEKTKHDKRKGGHGAKTLWDKFIIKSLSMSPQYLCFITPPAWRKPEHPLYPIMTQTHHMNYLHIYGKEKGKEIFGVYQRFDLYVIKTTPATNSKHITTVIDELNHKNTLHLLDWPFLPNYYYKEIKEILISPDPQGNFQGIPIIYSASLYDTRKLRPHKTQKYKYPVVHSINQHGPVYWYSHTNTEGHFHQPKVLLNFNMAQYPINDYEGKYGMSQLTFGIPIQTKTEGNHILKAINSDVFKEIIKATKWGAFQTDWRMFHYIKPDFYKHPQFLLKHQPKLNHQPNPNHQPKTKKRSQYTTSKNKTKRRHL